MSERPRSRLKAGAKSVTFHTMTNKTAPVGWVVQVTIPAPPAPPRADGSRWIGAVALSAPSFEYYNVAIAAPDNAIAATTKHVTKSEANDGEKSVVRGLSAAEIAALSLKAGEVKPA
jgi:hypothetical protein